MSGVQLQSLIVVLPGGPSHVVLLDRSTAGRTSDLGVGGTVVGVLTTSLPWREDRVGGVEESGRTPGIQVNIVIWVPTPGLTLSIDRQVERTLGSIP